LIFVVELWLSNLHLIYLARQVIVLRFERFSVIFQRPLRIKPAILTGKACFLNSILTGELVVGIIAYNSYDRLLSGFMPSKFKASFANGCAV